MPSFLMSHFIDLNLWNALQVVLLGFIGGILSGFIGSGGAFFMTPGMMNLGVPGVVAVGSNIAHKFGKALVGSRKHGELGNVDRRLGAFLILTSFIGIRFAVWVNSRLFKGGGGGSHGEGGGGAMSNLYISVVFVVILTGVAISMLRDALRSRSPGESSGPSASLANFFERFNLPPYIRFAVADVRISLWLILFVGLATGYLAGTIGVGGFIGVPAMIYLFRVPAAVATGTELYLAVFMGAFGAINYAYQGFVDLRLTMLLYLGSLLGIFVGVYGTKVVKEIMIRIVTGSIIILCVISRLLATPIYLGELGWIPVSPGLATALGYASKLMLFAAGITGGGIIIVQVVKAYNQRRRIQASLIKVRSQA